ncbi:sialate O-acetylesterase [Arthrobacter sp. M4]|uniref:sialate O-acetylesterase n=1 Tax=Arthrobacter sp. M4 TaxID=218160 RepID=UPI001CDD43E5|nr:sialate O-acetylesterase [Arthrobacter sp. M4]MCA4133054.1 sialate O-acetylesterase [Arthrobacter sp. M4]
MGRLMNALGGRRAKPSNDGYDVYLIAGQSNALGAGVTDFDPHLDRADSMVHQFAGCGRKAGQILEGTHPLWHFTRATGVGFGVEFGNRAAGASGKHVLLVPTARGETGFFPHNGFTWDPNDKSGAVNLFEFACRQLSKALATHPANRLRGVLWHQGEADTWHLELDEYAAMLDHLIVGFRTRFGEVPFIIGQMSPDRMSEGLAEGIVGYPKIDAAHRDTPRRMSLTAFVEAPAGLYNSANDKVHFSAAGQREFGLRYFEAYQQLASGARHRGDIGRAIS